MWYKLKDLGSNIDMNKNTSHEITPNISSMLKKIMLSISMKDIWWLNNKLSLKGAHMLVEG